MHKNRENEDRIREGFFYSAFLNRSSIKMMAINQKSKKKKKKKNFFIFFIFFFFLFLQIKNVGRPLFRRGGRG